MAFLELHKQVLEKLSSILEEFDVPECLTCLVQKLLIEPVNYELSRAQRRLFINDPLPSVESRSSGKRMGAAGFEPAT